MFWHIKLPCCFFGEQIECLYISLCSYLVYINTHVTLLPQTKIIKARWYWNSQGRCECVWSKAVPSTFTAFNGREFLRAILQ